MNDVLSTLFFVQFGLSGIVLCSTVYLLSVVSVWVSRQIGSRPIKFLIVRLGAHTGGK